MLRVTSLASGSSGNAFLVETSGAPLLVEAGLSARILERRLRERGVDPATLGAIIVSHEHQDHAQGAGPLARRWNIPVVCSAATQRALGAALAGVAWQPLTAHGTTLGNAEAWGFSVPHDAADPQGVLVEVDGVRLGWALDLGHVPSHIAPTLAQADLVVVEANHDRERLIASPYPWATKQRILGDQGHLSNLQAAQLIATLGADGRARTVWLAHLSARANEHPQGVLRTVRAYLEMAGCTTLELAIAERDQPSVQWTPHRLRQTALFEWAETHGS